MVDYTSKICEACSADATPATTREIEEFLQNHQDWFLSTEVDFPQLQRVYIFRNFEEAQKFANLIGNFHSQTTSPSMLTSTIRFFPVTVSMKAIARLSADGAFVTTLNNLSVAKAQNGEKTQMKIVAINI